MAGTATTFEWDGWDMIREVTPAGTYRDFAPQGEILTFDFTTAGGSPVTSTYNVRNRVSSGPLPLERGCGGSL